MFLVVLVLPTAAIAILFVHNDAQERKTAAYQRENEEPEGPMKSAGRIQWNLVLVTALLIEVGIPVILFPVSLLLSDRAVWMWIRIPIACLAVSYFVTLWLSRRMESRLAFHGLLIGILGTLIYLALLVGVGAFASSISRYGLALFLFFNGLRIIGATMAGFVAQHRRTAPKLVEPVV